ncbi:MAG: glycosyltransferase, partial [Holophagales bacterium]|nr:glycosyltransferase [Holophagales bacterium]
MSGRAPSSPRVSVVVPSYQHGEHVVEAVRSALDAELPGGPECLEVVVVDDGSTDDSVARLRAIDDPRLRLFEQENRGAHVAFGRGLELARGELVFLLNSDDAYEAGRLATFVDRFEADPELLFAASWLRIVDAGGRELGIKEAWHNLPPWPRPRPGPGLAELGNPGLALLESNWVSTTSNLAFRRRIGRPADAPAGDRFAAAGRLRFRPLRYCHDWDFLLELASLGRMELLEAPLVRYRTHDRNTIREGAAAEPGARPS